MVEGEDWLHGCLADKSAATACGYQHGPRCLFYLVESVLATVKPVLNLKGCWYLCNKELLITTVCKFHCREYEAVFLHLCSFCSLMKSMTEKARINKSKKPMVITSNKLGLRPMTNIKMNCTKNVCKILPGSCWKKVHLVVECKSMKKNQAINFHLIYDPFQSHQTSKISLPTLTPYWQQWKATATRFLTVRWWCLTVKRECFSFHCC